MLNQDEELRFCRARRAPRSVPFYGPGLSPVTGAGENFQSWVPGRGPAVRSCTYAAASRV